jgi:hypothetical protein
LQAIWQAEDWTCCIPANEDIPAEHLNDRRFCVIHPLLADQFECCHDLEAVSGFNSAQEQILLLLWNRTLAMNLASGKIPSLMASARAVKLSVAELPGLARWKDVRYKWDP